MINNNLIQQFILETSVQLQNSKYILFTLTQFYSHASWTGVLSDFFTTTKDSQWQKRRLWSRRENAWDYSQGQLGRLCGLRENAWKDSQGLQRRLWGLRESARKGVLTAKKPWVANVTPCFGVLMATLPNAVWLPIRHQKRSSFGK